MAGSGAVSHSKRLKLGLRHMGKQGTYSARRRAHRALEQDIAGWVAHVARGNTGELRARQESYVVNKAVKLRKTNN